MQEAPVSTPLEVTEPQEGGELRRIEEPCDLSHIDLSRPEISQAIRGAYRVLLRPRTRRLTNNPERK